MKTFEEVLIASFEDIIENFNQRTVSLSQVFDDIMKLSQAHVLGQSIERTNNGYIFNPTAREVEVADNHQSLFIVRRGGAHPFPIRIENRYPISKSQIINESPSNHFSETNPIME